MAPLGALAHKRPANDDAGDGNRDDKKRREGKRQGQVLQLWQRRSLLQGVQ